MTRNKTWSELAPGAKTSEFYLTRSSTVDEASQDLVVRRRHLGRTWRVPQVHAVTVQLGQSLLGDLDLKLGSGAAHVYWNHWHAKRKTWKQSHNRGCKQLIHYSVSFPNLTRWRLSLKVFCVSLKPLITTLINTQYEIMIYTVI